MESSRASRVASPPPTLNLSALLAQQEALAAQIAKAEALEAQRKKDAEQFEGSRVLAPASPSPRKKRPSTGVDPSLVGSGRPSQPRLSEGASRDAGAREELPLRNAYSVHDRHTVEYVRKKKAPSPESSALEKELRQSSFESGLRNVTKEVKRGLERKEATQHRSTSFDLARPKSLKPPPSTASSSSSSSRPSAGSSVTSKDKPRKSSSGSKGKQVDRSPPPKDAPSEGGMSRHKAPARTPSLAELAGPTPRALRSPSPNTRRIQQLEAEAEAEDSDELELTNAPEKLRHADGTLIEPVELGPLDHSRKMGYPAFPRLEPNSGIHLLSGTRRITHAQVQEHLDRRYALSPAQIYALGRPPTSSLNGEVAIEVDNDFVLIAVLAEKDQTRYVRADALKPEEKDEESERKKGRWVDPWKRKKAGEGEEEVTDEAFKKPSQKSRQRRYLNFTLVDLSTEKAAASGTGTLRMTLFEAEHEDDGQDASGNKVKRFFGGSGGAYEKFWKEEVGGVVAILNPTIKQFKSNTGSNVWSVSPTSAESIMVIGEARDLGRCKATVFSTGKQCESWCDKRVHELCGYHVQNAVKSTGAGRAETYSSTSSLSHTVSYDPAKFKAQLRGKPGRSAPAAYNAESKTGLLPSDNIPRSIEGSTTYVVRGSGSMGASANGRRTVIPPGRLGAAALASGNGAGGYIPGLREGPTVLMAKQQVVKEKREREERRRRELEVMQQDEGKTIGGEYVRKAREARLEAEAKRKGAKKGAVPEPAKEKDGEGGVDAEDEGRTRKRPFNAAAVRLIGYDPTGMRDEDKETKRRRLEAISALTATELDKRPKPKLGAPPGAKVRSGVVAPQAQSGTGVVWSDEEDDDDLVIEGAPSL